MSLSTVNRPVFSNARLSSRAFFRSSRATALYPSYPRCKKLKYCAMMVCAGREKLSENEYSTEPR